MTWSHQTSQTIWPDKSYKAPEWRLRLIKVHFHHFHQVPSSSSPIKSSHQVPSLFTEFKNQLRLTYLCVVRERLTYRQTPSPRAPGVQAFQPTVIVRVIVRGIARVRLKSSAEVLYSSYWKMISNALLVRNANLETPIWSSRITIWRTLPTVAPLSSRLCMFTQNA